MLAPLPWIMRQASPRRSEVVDPSKHPFVEAKPLPLRDSPPPSVLIVEDDPALRELLASFLTEEGYTVRAAQNGRAACEQVQESTPDVVVLDLLMPVMGGREVLTAWLKDGLVPELPVLVLSSLPHWGGPPDDVLRRSTRACLRKPFSLGALLGTIEGLVSPRQPSRWSAPGPGSPRSGLPSPSLPNA